MYKSHPHSPYIPINERVQTCLMFVPQPQHHTNLTGTFKSPQLNIVIHIKNDLTQPLETLSTNIIPIPQIDQLMTKYESLKF